MAIPGGVFLAVAIVGVAAALFWLVKSYIFGSGVSDSEEGHTKEDVLPDEAKSEEVVQEEDEIVDSISGLIDSSILEFEKIKRDKSYTEAAKRNFKSRFNAIKNLLLRLKTDEEKVVSLSKSILVRLAKSERIFEEKIDAERAGISAMMNSIQSEEVELQLSEINERWERLIVKMKEIIGQAVTFLNKKIELSMKAIRLVEAQMQPITNLENLQEINDGNIDNIIKYLKFLKAKEGEIKVINTEIKEIETQLNSILSEIDNSENENKELMREAHQIVLRNAQSKAA